MATDRTESTRRGQSLTKTTTKHPYAAIEHRVIDSQAFVDMTFSARSLLLEMSRQLTKDNNGHLQATYSYMQRHGFSENTLSRAIAELISHGMLYRTRTGGYQQGAAQYAVTWLPIKNRNGIYLDGFKSCAWRDWQPRQAAKKKTRPQKMMDTHRKNGEWAIPTPPKIEAESPPKTEDNELMPCSAVISVQSRRKKRERPLLKSPLAIRLVINNDRGATCSKPNAAAPEYCRLDTGHG